MSDQTDPSDPGGGGDFSSSPHELGQQLDELLNQIDQAEAIDPSRNPLEESADAPPPANDPPARPPPESSTEDLAQQIQSLLDQKQDASAPAPSAASASTPPEGEDRASAAPPAQEGGRTMGELDRMLADQADDAVMGEFETISQVLEEESARAEQAGDAGESPKPEGEQAGGEQGEGEQAGDAEKPVPPDATEEPRATPEPAASPPDDEASGGEEAPQPAAPSGGEAASSAAEPPQVEPEAERKTAGEGEPNDQPTDPAPPRADPPGRRLPRLSPKLPDLRRLDRPLRMACHTLNRPLDYLPAEAQTTLGWIALAVFLPALALVAYGLLT